MPLIQLYEWLTEKIVTKKIRWAAKNDTWISAYGLRKRVKITPTIIEIIFFSEQRAHKLFGSR